MAANDYRARTNHGVDYAPKGAETDRSQVSYGKDGNEDYKLIDVGASDIKRASEILAGLLENKEHSAISEALGVRFHEALKDQGEKLTDIRQVEIVNHKDDWNEVPYPERSLTDVFLRTYEDKNGKYYPDADGKITVYTANHAHQTYDHDGRLEIMSIRTHNTP